MMSIISSENYLTKIKPFINQPIIKIITGMRRVGKSTFLQIIKDELLSTVPESNIIFINFESLNTLHIRNEMDFYD